MEEVKPSAPKYLSLMDTFKLYLWTYWKSGHMSDESTANILGFVDRLTDAETADLCFGQLEELKTSQKTAYEGVVLNDAKVNGAETEEITIGGSKYVQGDLFDTDTNERVG